MSILINYTENLYKIMLLTKCEYESLCEIFTKNVDETKNDSFLKN